MRIFLSVILSSVLMLSACSGGDPAPGQPRLVVEPRRLLLTDLS